MSTSDEEKDPFERSKKIPREGQDPEEINQPTSSSSDSDSSQLIEPLDSDYSPGNKNLDGVSSNYELRSKDNHSKTPISLDDSLIEDTNCKKPILPEILITPPEVTLQKIVIPPVVIETPDKKMADIPFEKIITILPNLVGNPKSLEAFLNKADLIFSNCATANSKLTFVNCVKSCTVDTLKIKISDSTDWVEIRKILLSEILPTRNISQLGDELSKITQLPGESIQSYSDRIYQLTYTINTAYEYHNPDASADAMKMVKAVNEKNTLNAFIKGLSGDMKNWVKARDFKLMSLAVLYAKEQEHEYDAGKILEKKTNSNTRANKPTSQPKCFRCKNLGHYAHECVASSRPINKPKDFSQKKENIQFCSFCNRTGHSIDNCFSAKRSKNMSCSYCGLNNHTTQNCLRKIADQPNISRPRQINHFSTSDQILAQINLSQLMDSLAVNARYRPVNYQQGMSQIQDISNVPQQGQNSNEVVRYIDTSNRYSQNASNNSVNYSHQGQIPSEIVRSSGNINHLQATSTQQPLFTFENNNQALNGLSGDNTKCLEPSTFQVIGTPNQNQNLLHFPISNSKNY